MAEWWQTKAFVCHQINWRSVQEEVAHEGLRMPPLFRSPEPRAWGQAGRCHYLLKRKGLERDVLPKRHFHRFDFLLYPSLSGNMLPSYYFWRTGPPYCFRTVLGRHMIFRQLARHIISRAMPARHIISWQCLPSILFLDMPARLIISGPCRPAILFLDNASPPYHFIIVMFVCPPVVFLSHC